MLLPFTAVFLLIAACATAPLTEPENTLPAEKLLMTPAVEIVDMRLPILETYEQELNRTTLTEGDARTKNNPLCLKITESLWLDAHGNLFLNTEEVLNLTDSPSWEVSYSPKDRRVPYSVSRDENSFRIERKGIISKTIKVEFKDDIIYIDGGFSNSNININDDSYELEGMFGLSKKQAWKIRDGYYELGDRIIRTPDENTVEISYNATLTSEKIWKKTEYKLIREDNAIVLLHNDVTSTNLVNFKEIKRIYRTANGFIIADRKPGKWVTDDISVTESGLKGYGYTIKLK